MSVPTLMFFKDGEKVKELVGLPSLVHINKLARGVLEYDAIGALAAVDEVVEDPFSMEY